MNSTDNDTLRNTKMHHYISMHKVKWKVYEHLKIVNTTGIQIFRIKDDNYAIKTLLCSKEKLHKNEQNKFFVVLKS